MVPVTSTEKHAEYDLFCSINAMLHMYLSTSIFPLKLVNLVLPIPQLLQIPRQLPLILRTFLRPRNRLVQSRRPTHKDLEVAIFRLREHGLQQILGNVSGTTVPSRIGGFVDEVECAETLGVGVFYVFEFAFEEDVVFGQVAVDEGDAGFVGGVFEDGADELVHSVAIADISIICHDQGKEVTSGYR